MDDIATSSSNNLYEEDFYAWTQAQAALLRQGCFDEADVANILDEIESLGRVQVAELRSRLKILIHHLLKEIYQPELASRSSATTIVLERQDIGHLLDGSPSLKPKAVEIFARTYGAAREVTAVETGISLKILPTRAPFTYAQAMDEDFWPGRSIEDRD